MEQNYNNNYSLNDIPVWAIVLLFVFFWPLGIVLLILKLSNKNVDKIETLKTKKISNIIVTSIMIFIGLFFLLVAIVGISDVASNTKDTETIGAFVFVLIIMATFIGFGIWRCKKAVEINNKIKKIYKYQNIIIDREIYDLNEIASYTNISKVDILNDVSNYVSEGYLKGIRVRQNKIEKIPEYISPDRIRNVICPNCGASNKYIEGKENKCGYCYTTLNTSKV